MLLSNWGKGKIGVHHTIRLNFQAQHEALKHKQNLIFSEIRDIRLYLKRIQINCPVWLTKDLRKSAAIAGVSCSCYENETNSNLISYHCIYIF